MLAGPIALARRLLRRAWSTAASDEGVVRGAIGGLVFGSFVLLGLEILNTDPKAYLGDPQAGLVFVTTIAGGILGALGAELPRAPRARARRRLGLDLGGRERRLDLLHEPALRQRADDLVGDLAVLEEEQRRDRHDVVLRRRPAGSRRCSA